MSRDIPVVPNAIGPPVNTLAELPARLSQVPVNAACRMCLIGSEARATRRRQRVTLFFHGDRGQYRVVHNYAR